MERPGQSVCVIIPAFNAEATIGRAVRSALEQPETKQVVVVDDASSDATYEAALAADDGTGRLHLFRQAANTGPAAARNRALDLASAAWVSLLDADDYFLPGRLERLLQLAGEFDFIADDPWRYHPGQESWTQLIGAERPLPLELTFAAFVRGNLSPEASEGQELGFLKPLMRIDYLRKNNLRYDEQLRFGEDFVLYARALAAGARFLIAGPSGYVAVNTEGSLSNEHRAEDLEALAAACGVLLTLPLRPEARKLARRHLHQVEQKLQLRRTLDIRRREGSAQALLHLARKPRMAPYVMRESLIGLWRRRRADGPRREDGKNSTERLAPPGSQVAEPFARPAAVRREKVSAEGQSA